MGREVSEVPIQTHVPQLQLSKVPQSIPECRVCLEACKLVWLHQGPGGAIC